VQIIVSGSDDTFIKVWDRRVGFDRPVGVLAGHTEGVTYLEERGDGVYLLSNSKDQSAKLWDIRAMLESCPRRTERFDWDYRWQSYPGLGVPYENPNDVSCLT